MVRMIGIATLLSFGSLGTAWAQQQPPAGVVGSVMGRLPSRSEAELKAQIAAAPNDPRTFWAYQELAQFYRQNNRIEEAEHTLRSALPLARTPGMVYGPLTSLFSPQYQPDRLLAITSEWIGADPANPVPYTMQANVHVEFARRLRLSPPEARVHLEQARQLIADARRIDENHMSIVGPEMNIIRAQMEMETDPAVRAKLQQDIDALMQTVRARTPAMTSQLTTGFSGAVGGVVTSGSSSGGAARFPNAVRVGGNIRQPVKLRHVNPVYPPEAQQARVQGVVIIEAVIGIDGRVVEAHVLRSISLLDKAAIEAVLQWEFSVTQLNGEPVPVIMTVTVSFNMQ